VVGEIALDWDALTSDAEPDQQIIIYTAEPGSPAEQALRDLAAWAAETLNSSVHGSLPARRRSTSGQSRR
jgi:hypothetical protein